MRCDSQECGSVCRQPVWVNVAAAACARLPSGPKSGVSDSAAIVIRNRSDLVRRKFRFSTGGRLSGPNKSMLTV